MKKGMTFRLRLLTIISVLSLMVLHLVGFSPSVEAAPTWTKSSSPLTLDGERFVTDSWVVKIGSTYEMWYTHGGTTLSLTEIINQIKVVATSQMVNDLAGFDLASLFGVDLPLTNIDALWTLLGTTSTTIGYATSVDGINWHVVKHDALTSAGAGWDSVSAPCVVKTASGYQMWYTHSWLNLTKAELGTALTNLGDPAERVDAFMTLLASVSTTIGYATSNDGQTWTVVDPGVITTSGSALWKQVSEPSVLFNGTQYDLWYTNAETNLTQTDVGNMVSKIYGGTFGATDLFGLFNNFSSTIRYATSADGQVWSTPQDTTGIATLGFGVFSSASSPSVVKTINGYEMWYTHAQTDLNVTAFTNLMNAVKALKANINALWASFSSGDLNAFLQQLVLFLDGDSAAVPPVEALINPIKPFLANTNTVIGYATSNDGVTWTINNSQSLTGTTGNLWSSVSAPAVIVNNSKYEMWFTQGLDDLTAQGLVDRLQGTMLPIGYASYIASVNLNLVTGWNLIGLPFAPNPSTPQDVFSAINTNIRTVWAYDGATGIWTYYKPGSTQGGLTQILAGKGYWIELTNSATLTISGTKPPFPYNVELAIGWNLISVPKTPNPSAIQDVLAGIVVHVRTVWAYDAATGIWTYYKPGSSQGGLTEVIEGRAYWIEMTASDTLIIN